MLTTDTSIKRRVSRLLFFFTVIIAGTSIFSSCSKKTEEGAVGAEATISITVGGITTEDVATPGGKTKSMSLAPQTIHGETIANRRVLKNGKMEMSLIAAESSNISSAEDIDLEAPIYDLVKQPSRYKQMSSASLNSPALSAVIPGVRRAMASGVKYWFVLKNRSTQAIEQSVQVVSGTTLKLDVVKGQYYDWYAYSYDNTDNIPPLDANNPKVQTYTDKPLLYASGEARVQSFQTDISVQIEFKHQLKLLKIHIDSRGILGDITDHIAEFVDNDYIKTGLFNVIDGTLGSLTTVPTTTLSMVEEVQGSHQFLVDQYYTADIVRDRYKFKVSELKIKLPDGTPQDLLANFPSGREETFIFSDGGKGKIHYAMVDIWRNITKKRIMQFEPSEEFSLAAGQIDRPSGAFFKAPINFGPGVECHMRIEEMSRHVIIPPSRKGEIYDYLEGDQYKYDPDIVIATGFANYDSTDYKALYKHLQRGGGLLLMASKDNGSLIEKHILKKIFPNSSNLSTNSVNEQPGVIFKLNQVDVNIQTWPFGDVRNRYWGTHGYETLYLENLSAADLNDIEVYSYGPVNKNNHRLTSISMFRHKKLNFFYVGDEGFLASRMTNLSAQDNSSGENPFTVNADLFPVPRRLYGRIPESSAVESGNLHGWSVQNSILFGNIISWLLMQSEYNGLEP
ncbi:hypothetical protein [Sphingobacterium tabacisoli]|uniref:Uncharacterized protein n=1 Tax=Sphingobacterium tabacisoli TaxID=2044855 RepID=A0ABW5L7C8_9SPHI|nr:hypothetical protein [Sphingobacterium tabacisoli]